MARVAKENQGLETTFVDLENADEGEVRAALQENTKVSITFANVRVYHKLTWLFD